MDVFSITRLTVIRGNEYCVEVDTLYKLSDPLLLFIITAPTHFIRPVLQTEDNCQGEKKVLPKNIINLFLALNCSYLLVNV